MAFIRHMRFAALAAALFSSVSIGVVAGTQAPAAAAVVNDAPSTSPMFNGAVHAVAFGGETVYVGGSFTSATFAGTSYPRSRLAAFNARTGALLDWKPAADATVRAIAVDGGTVYAAGEFTVINAVKRDSIAAFNAVTGELLAFKHGIGGLPRALGVGNGRLYLGGRITSVDGLPRSNLAAFVLGTGALDADWRPVTDDTVESLAVAADRVYAGGLFRVTNGVSGYAKLMALHPVTGAVDRGFAPKATVVAHAVAVTPTAVYAAYGGQGGKAVAYHFTGSVRWSATMDGDAQAITELGGTVYVGGHFDNVCTTNTNGSQGVCTDGSVPRVKFAAFDATGGLLSWAPKGNGIVGVRSLIANESLQRIVAGGDFTLVNDVARKRVAVFAG